MRSRAILRTKTLILLNIRGGTMDMVILWCNQNQGFIMAALTFVYVATTLFIWKSNDKTAYIASKQLEEMARERISRGRPFLVASEISLKIKRPEFFYTPPEDRYSFGSIYELSIKICNLSSDPALFVDFLAKLEIPDKTTKISIDTIARRDNFISRNNANQLKNLHFCGDSDAKFFSSLRNEFSKPPQLELLIYYRNASGGYFKATSRFKIGLYEKDMEILRNWHVVATQAPVKYEENLRYLKRISEQKEWFSAFNEVRQDFITSLGEHKEISLQVLEIPEEFELKQIDEIEYTTSGIKYSIDFNCPVANQDEDI